MISAAAVRQPDDPILGLFYCIDVTGAGRGGEGKEGQKRLHLSQVRILLFLPFSPRCKLPRRTCIHTTCIHAALLKEIVPFHWRRCSSFTPGMYPSSQLPDSFVRSRTFSRYTPMESYPCSLCSKSAKPESGKSSFNLG